MQTSFPNLGNLGSSDAEGAYSRLKEAGFVDIETSAEPASTPFENSAHYTEFVRTAIVHRHLSRLPGVELRQSFLQDLAEQAAQDDPTLNWIIGA